MAGSLSRPYTFDYNIFNIDEKLTAHHESVGIFLSQSDGLEQ